MVDSTYEELSKEELSLEEEVNLRLRIELEKIVNHFERYLGDFPGFISMYLQGEIGIAAAPIEAENKINLIGYDDLKDRATRLFKQAQEIVKEKGYRHTGGQVMSNYEHKKVGSSGFDDCESLPNMVVRFAREILDKKTEFDTMTLEEIRRARILAGMPTIDDKGNVTNQIVQIKDSYHFLTPKRAAEVRKLEAQIIDEFNELMHETYFRHFAGLFIFGISFRQLVRGKISTEEALELLGTLRVDKDLVPSLKEVIELAKQTSYDLGYRDPILTPQELFFLGRNVDQKYLARPYTPLGIQDRTITIEEANRMRKSEQFFKKDTDKFSVYAQPWLFSLEPLNDNGETMRGPQLICSYKMAPIDEEFAADLRSRLKNPISFSRQGVDWYHIEKSS